MTACTLNCHRDGSRFFLIRVFNISGTPRRANLEQDRLGSMTLGSLRGTELSFHAQQSFTDNSLGEKAAHASSFPEGCQKRAFSGKGYCLGRYRKHKPGQGRATGSTYTYPTRSHSMTDICLVYIMK